MRGASVLLFLFISLGQPLLSYSQWNPDAGLIQPLSAGAVTTASSSGAAASKVIDGNEQTSWQSAGTLPNLYIGRSDLNIFLRATNNGVCSNSSGANCKNITDGNLNSSATFGVAAGKAWAEVALAQASPLRNVSIKCYSTDTVFAWVFLSGNDSVRIGYSTPANNYAVLRFPYVTSRFTKIKIVSKKSFALYEVAALAGYPTEYVTIDLGSVKSIGTVVTRHWSGTASSAISTELLVSSDQVSWQLVANLNPDALLAVTTDINPPVNGRYVRVQHTIEETDYAKVSIWEAKVFDEYGQYGPMPEPAQSNVTVAELLGVNGIWGWGHNMFSNSIPQGQGPSKFSEVAAHARNYHNLYWDVSDPDSIPDYENMPFGLAVWWLDWDREYQAWKDAGLKVGATIQYNNNTVHQSKWTNPYLAAYNYAFAFARHFGPTYGNGLVDFFEAGNEPWDYPASFYNQIQSGMLRGAKDGDSALFVLPCALQADNPGKETATGGNYMGARLLEQDASYIDAINVHHYSYTQNQNGIRIAVHPESKESELRGIMNDIRFRDANLPGKKIYITEWGWDSDGAGESCTFGECVSENEQALYGVRGALMFLRLGIDRASWYFYGNQNSGNLYSRCGLENTQHQNKKSFYAFQALLSKLGNKYFIETLREDDEAWVYLFGDSSGNATHIAAWRPIDGDDNSSVWIDIESYFPDSAWTITGQTATGEYAPANVSHDQASIKCRISSVPLVIKLGAPATHTDCAGVENGTALPDDCGICSGGTTGHVANSDKDCSGVCFGTTTVDCHGDCNGTAFFDDCGICSGGNTGHVANSNKDCSGVCFGTAAPDSCGVCNGDNLSCRDCNGDFFGTAFPDDCGICSGGNSAHVANSDKDCNGVCFGTATVDCHGDCNGTAFFDGCGICSGGNTGRAPGQQFTFFRDADNDGFGNASVTVQACSLPAGYVADNTDCNDDNANINPAKTDVCGNSLDENCDGIALATPATPGAISGAASVCKGSTAVAYSVPAAAGVAQYVWTSSSNSAAIASGQGTNAILVNFSSNFSSATLRVSARNACGTGIQRSLSITALYQPSTPGPISGAGSVCRNQANLTYSVSAVTGAASYVWTFPAGVTITSGQGTRTVVVTWGATGGTVSVVAISSSQCRSGARTKSVSASACKMDSPQHDDAAGTHENIFMRAYPNPFGEMLTIEFTLQEDAHARVEVFNVSGQRIALLFEGTVAANERHALQFAPFSSEGSMYIYRLQTETDTYYGKVLQMK